MGSLARHSLPVDLPPPAIAALPIVRGYHVPWFVLWQNGEPEFRKADIKKFVCALRERRCWICGEPLRSGVGVFVLLSTIAPSMIAPEPPCHRECAKYAVKVCPYLALPHSKRRLTNIDTPLVHRDKDTDVIALITANAWALRRDQSIAITRPVRVEYFRAGQPADSPH